MSVRIPVHTDALTVRLPETIDTNETYYLIGPDGFRYPVMFDFAGETGWSVVEL